MVKVLHFVSKMDRAGQETFLMNVFRNINKDKVQFGFLCTLNTPGDYDKEINDLGGELHYEPIKKAGHFKIIKNQFILIKTLRTLVSKYQVFEIHTQHAMDAVLSAIAAKIAGFHTVIIHSHNSSSLYHPKLHLIFKHFLRLLNVQRFACSNSAGKWMFGNSSFLIIKNGINLNDFIFSQNLRKKVREEMKWQGKTVIGHIGRFNSQKNQEFLIKIFNKYYLQNKNARLILIGAGENEDKIKKQVEKLNLQKQVSFLGIRTDVGDLYQGMDAFVFPSLFEGLPVVLVEAQAASLPCLVSDSVTNEIKITNKIIFKELNASSDEWANALKSTLSSFQTRINETDNINKAGYNIKKVSKKLESLYLSY